MGESKEGDRDEGDEQDSPSAAAKLVRRASREPQQLLRKLLIGSAIAERPLVLRGKRGG